MGDKAPLITKDAPLTIRVTHRNQHSHLDDLVSYFLLVIIAPFFLLAL